MEKFRSMSTREGAGRMQKLSPPSMQDLRSYSTNSHVPYSSMDYNNNREVKIKRSNNKSKVMSSSSKGWNFDELELQRKKRVVGYKAYAMEGKMRSSFRKSFKWIKDTCDHVVHGWW
ncbi:unnamed protein product [Withania somnifera]